jgi:hypothetical protein
MGQKRLPDSLQKKATACPRRRHQTVGELARLTGTSMNELVSHDEVRLLHPPKSTLRAGLAVAPRPRWPRTATELQTEMCWPIGSKRAT